MTAHGVSLVEQITFVLGRHDPGAIFADNPDAPPDEYEGEAEAIIEAAPPRASSYVEVRAAVGETLTAAFTDVRISRRKLRTIAKDIARVYEVSRGRGQ